MLLAGSFSSEMTHPHRCVRPSGLSTGTPQRLSKHPKLSTSRHVSSCVPALNTSATAVNSNVKPAATVTIVCRPGLRSPTHNSSQPTSTTASPGDDLMTAAERCGADITTGCLSGSCGLCEVRHHCFIKSRQLGRHVWCCRHRAWLIYVKNRSSILKHTVFCLAEVDLGRS